MKTFKVIVLAVVMVLANGAFANAEKTAKKSSAELDVTIEAQVDGRVIVGFEKLADEKVFIEIYDTYGSLIHSEKVVDKTVILKRYDLSRFPAGRYSYEVSNNQFSVKKVIEKK